MPVNNTAKQGLQVFSEALQAMKSKLVVADIPTGAYEFQDEKITPKQRQKSNNEAVALLRELQLDPNRKATEEEKLILSRYTGKGGNLEVDGVKGSQYEYYTPLPLANAMWDLMKEMGFDGGAVLDPCAGTGIFSVGRPENVVMQSVELDEVSGSINAMINDQQNHNVIVSPFEAVAAKVQDNSYDAVITNVPFGSKAARGDNPRLDIYADDDLDSYFVKRSIDKLKFGKLGVFLASTKLMTGASSRKFRQQIALKAELVGAYRLPNKVFHPTGADVVTDIIVFRKHTEALTEKIDNLYQNGQIDVLKQSRVLDADIIAGKYFKTEGMKNVLGQSVMVQDWRNKQKEIEAVVSDDSLANIAKLIRRFPDSRIDLELLEMAETQTLPSIADGDVRVMGGTTFEYQGGQWVPIKRNSGFNNAESFETALAAFHAGMTYGDLTQYQAYCQSAGSILPKWAESLLSVAKGDQDAYSYWLVQFALYQALQTDIRGKYADNYQVLTSAMLGVASNVANKKYKSAALRTMTTFNAKAFDGNGLSDYWYGTALEVAQDLDAKGAYENAVYMGRADNFMVSVDDIKASDPTFDPLSNDDYAINADGSKVSLNRDYYSGNYGEFLLRIEAEIDAATDPKIREKLIKQREKAREYINIVDVNSLNLSLRATNIDLSIKSDFLSIYGGNDVFINAEGRVEVQEKVPTFEDILWLIKQNHFTSDIRVYFLNRLLDSINNNSRLSLRVPKDVKREDHDLVMTAYLKYVKEIDATFSSYLHANEPFMKDLDQKINDPMNKQMVTELDESPIEIQGFAPKFDGFEALQTYQCAEIRRLSRRLEGITGFDVGLGKTMTSIAAVQNLQNIGVKKRTMFVVPSHTISKWYRDMGMTLTDHSSVLVIGSNENKNESIDSSKYGSDLNQLIKSKQWRIVLITSDAFTMIPVKESTIENYYASKMAKYDFSKDKDREASKAFIAGKKAPLQKEQGRLPFFEDLAVDSIVFDEGQMFKNGDASEGTGNFNTIRGLSLLAEAQLSDRAVSAKIKAEYVRGQNELGDGVILLSATPITNSPAEIFTMLSLSVGEKKARNILGGASIETVDDFLSTFTNTESIEGVDITGGLRSDETFTGFKNVSLLKNAIHSVANIQTARENELKIPDEEPVKQNIELSPSNKQALSDLKRAYNIAKLDVKGLPVFEEDRIFIDQLSQRLGEPMDLIAHPFNLITKMQDLILMGQDSVLERSYYVDYISPEDETLTQQVVDAFNKKPPKFRSKRTYPLVEQADVKIKSRGKNFGDADEYEITVRAFMDEDQNRLYLTANDMKAISVLFEIADKFGLRLKPKLSEKLQAMIDTFKQEMSTPMHNGHAKQLIFCDTLAMHHTIKQALIEYCGVEKSRIAILNASIKPDGSSGVVKTDDVQDIQDGFASDRYTVVIANKKADTGIDLQKGTQAIHHLTTGWTPDSLQQRNGRGVRQGNKQEKVRVYYYNANGSFDEYKLQVINGKSDWIGGLMNKDMQVDGTLAVSGELSDEDLDLMIQADSAEAIEGLLKQRKDKEIAARLDRATKHSQMLLMIARRSAIKANVDESKVTTEIIVSDYSRYVALMKADNKAKTSEQRRSIADQKQAIITQYNGYIPNNTVENWDASLGRFAEPRGGEVRSVSSLLSHSFGSGFQSSALVENILGEDRGPMHARTTEKYKSLQRMAESTKEQLLNYADSPFTKEEREMLFNGTARYFESKNSLECNGDIIKSVSTEGAVLYGMVTVEQFQVKNVFASAWDNHKGTVSKIEPNERAAAIQAFIEYESSALKGLEKFDYSALSKDEMARVAKFSQVLPEVRKAVNDQLGELQDDWLKGSTVIYVQNVRHKEEKRYYWSENLFSELYRGNPELVKAYNAVFDGLIDKVEVKGKLAELTIQNEKMDQFEQITFRSASYVMDEVYMFAEVHKMKINFEGVDSNYVQDFYSEHSNKISTSFNLALHDQITLPYSYDTALSDAQKDEVLKAILNHAIGQLTVDVTPFMERASKDRNYQVIIKRFALDESSPEALVQKHVKLHEGMGRFKNIKLTGVAFLGTGSFGSEFKSVYKDRMKAYADTIYKKCVWDGRNTCWVVDAEVMIWMMKQDWFKLDQVEFY